MMIWFYIMGSVAVVSGISLIGAAMLFLRESRVRTALFLLVSLSAGALLGDVFLHLLPQLFQKSNSPLAVSVLILGGVLLFFVLEKFLYWRHCHTEGNEEEARKIRPLGALVLVGDAAHNALDGIVIAASYLVSIEAGIATTLAVILHEIPQEIGDFGVLLHVGFSKGRALFFNFMSALAAFGGALVVWFLGGFSEGLTVIALAVAAGTFLYIAGSDLIPEIHKTSDTRRSLIQFFTVLLGIALMALLLIIE